MTSLVFPSLPGLSWNRGRSYVWKSTVIEAMSGKESRIGHALYPRVKFSLSYEYLSDRPGATSDLKAIAGLFNACRGEYDTFLYSDPEFNSVTAEPFGTGDGTTTSFQLVAKYQNSGGPGVAELIQNLNGAPQIYDLGSLRTVGTHYTLGATGIITFVTPPVGGHALTWTGGFYYRARFLAGQMDLTQFMSHMWQSKAVDFLSVKL